ncbi:LacI family transcriptional regulator [Bogoriella caseilytica]|uniref:LacI family transcriptional regulator n=2 Tax=Bogoriella caseilytica TaxID=56055 RepID=A0A3N2BB07_9MICO|nr:LacI family transcriptional regulator [Bogoriella caseilytica]
MASYKDIQRETGLSLATISKYFNGKTVLERNRTAIELAAQTLDYRPNDIARSLRRRRSSTVGVLLPALNNDFHLTIVASVEETLRAAGYSVIVATSVESDGRAVELMLRRMVEGIITVPTPSDVAALRDVRGRLPIVVVDWEAPELHTDGVFLDNVAAGRMAGRHLLDHGHTRIALLGGERSVSTMRQRRQGFLSALSEVGVCLPEEFDGAEPLVVSAGREAMARMLGAPTRPTAVFCANYELTVGAVIAINESGLRIGREISLVGFDGVDLAKVTVPPMTLIAQPTAAIGRGAAEILLQRLAAEPSDEAAPQLTRLAPQFVAGGSVLRLDDP